MIAMPNIHGRLRRTGGPLAAVVALCLSSGEVLGQPAATDTLRQQIEERFDVLPLSDGVVLRPKSGAAGVRSVEVTGATVALDGIPATGAELREKLGADADLVVQLSYLDVAARRRLFGGAGVETPAGASPAQAASPPRGPSGDRVRIGGSVTVSPDEIVSGDVVAIGGSVRVEGEVRGEVVAVGGSVDLGPGAVVEKDVVVIGGTLRRDPTSRVSGAVHEVGIGPFGHGRWRSVHNPLAGLWLGRTLGSPFALLSSLIRVSVLCLLAALVVLLGREHVERTAARAATEPFKAGAVGFLSQLLFLPVLIMTIVVLVVTIVGIPLLVLIPFALLGLGLVGLVGFTAVAQNLGRLLATRLGWSSVGPYAATLAGIFLVLSPLLIARLTSLAGGALLPVALGLGLVATLIEYLAWTVGFGAVALGWFNRARVSPATAAS